MTGNADLAESEHVAAVERAMIEIRRLQMRRSLGRLSQRRSGHPIDMALTEVVDAVEQHDRTGSPCTVSTVAATLGVDQPSASRAVARAVAVGLLVRVADQSDGRRVCLALTSAGAAHAEQVHRFRRTVFADAVAGWTPHDISTFALMLTRFVESYRTISADTAR
jgi:DNA-binding MarR family transcriptional regulator